MAYEIGTATNYRDLLDKLRLFLTTNSALVAAGQNWMQKRWVQNATTQELVLMGPGLAGGDQVYIGVASFENTTSDYYNWDLMGYTGYDSLATIYGQPGSSNPAGTLNNCLHLWNSSIPYWFIANGRRVIISARVNTKYFQAYLGLATPYATPAQYPYPMCIVGSNTSRSSRWSAVSTGRTPYCLKPDGTWQATSKWPLGSTTNQLSVLDDGSYPLIQTVTHDSVTYYSAETVYKTQYIGELDGWFFCPGRNNVSENIITYGGKNHVVMQNGDQVGLGDYIALKLE